MENFWINYKKSRFPFIKSLRPLRPLRLAERLLKNDEGAIVIVAMLILVLLTIIGISIINTSTFESQIAGNEHRYKIDFYMADSGWRQSAMWLENLGGPPPTVNGGGDNIVKNFGLNTEAANSTPSDLSGLTPDNASLSQYGIPYWFQVEYLSDGPVVGSGKGFREFFYQTASNANQTQQVQVQLSKIYKVGY